MPEFMTYADSGPNYDDMDPYKIKATRAALLTGNNAVRLGFEDVPWSRGESCYLMKAPWGYLAHVEEGLGTKNIVADAMYQLMLVGKLSHGYDHSFYRHVAQCTVAMIVNDMLTLGALPVSIAMHLAVAESKWLTDGLRVDELIDGWKQACDLSGAVWAGGETPTLRDLVMPKRIILSGSALGVIIPKERVIKPNIQHGDSIILLGSSGIHANGLTLARDIAKKLPKGYRTPVGKSTYGEELLKPTIIYRQFIENCLKNRIGIHYAVNITGHGWRKLMRAVEPFVYVIDRIPEPQPIFGFIQEHGPVTDEEMYGNYNMGAGFAVFVRPDVAPIVLRIADKYGYSALQAGYVDKRGGEKKLIIRPKNLEYEGSSLAVR